MQVKFSLLIPLLIFSVFIPSGTRLASCQAQEMQRFGQDAPKGRDGARGQDGQDSANTAIFVEGSPISIDLSGNDGLPGEDGTQGADAICEPQPLGVTQNLIGATGGEGGNGGNGGKSIDVISPVNGGTTGYSENNFNGGTVLAGGVEDNNNGQNGGTDRDAGGTLGGDSIYNNTADPARLFTSVKSPNHNGNNVALTNNQPGIPGGGTSNNVNYSGQAGTTITFNYVNDAYGGGGGGAGSNNAGNDKPGLMGAPGAPGYAVIYKYLS